MRTEDGINDQVCKSAAVYGERKVHGCSSAGQSENMGNRMQQGRELWIPIFLPVNLALRVSEAAGTYFENCYLFCSRNCKPSALLSF